MKQLIVTVASIICISIFMDNLPVANAESVNMGVNVLARKSTDTINDFDFSKINSGIQTAHAENSGEVKGVQTLAVKLSGCYHF